MEVSLNQHSLRRLTRALMCLTKFGEDVHFQALDEKLVLSSINISKTSYAQFEFAPEFFETFSVRSRKKTGIRVHLNTKALLGILRSRGIDKTLERCEMTIVDRDQETRYKPYRHEGQRRKKLRAEDEDESEEDRERGYTEDEDEDVRPDARLIVKLFCQHDFSKIHHLHISTDHPISRPTAATQPQTGAGRSTFTIGPKSILDWMKPFTSWSNPEGGGGARDGERKEAYLAWGFGLTAVRINSWEGNAKTGQLSTEFVVFGSDFDEYDVVQGNINLGFPMREFKAITTLATFLSVPLTTSFIGPNTPLTIRLSQPDDSFDVRFILMTQEVPPSALVKVQQGEPVVKEEKVVPKRFKSESIGAQTSQGSRHGRAGPELELNRDGRREEDESVQGSARRGGSRRRSALPMEQRDEDNEMMAEDLNQPQGGTDATVDVTDLLPPTTSACGSIRQRPASEVQLSHRDVYNQSQQQQSLSQPMISRPRNASAGPSVTRGPLPRSYSPPLLSSQQQLSRGESSVSHRNLTTNSRSHILVPNSTLSNHSRPQDASHSPDSFDTVSSHHHHHHHHHPTTTDRVRYPSRSAAAANRSVAASTHEEPLFFASQESEAEGLGPPPASMPRSSQLSQAQLAAAGLGDIEELDLIGVDEDEDESFDQRIEDERVPLSNGNRRDGDRRVNDGRRASHGGSGNQARDVESADRQMDVDEEAAGAMLLSRDGTILRDDGELIIPPTQSEGEDISYAGVEDDEPSDEEEWGGEMEQDDGIDGWMKRTAVNAAGRDAAAVEPDVPESQEG